MEGAGRLQLAHSAPGAALTAAGWPSATRGKGTWEKSGEDGCSPVLATAAHEEGAGWESRGWGCGLPQWGISLERDAGQREERESKPEAKIRRMEEGPQPQWEEGRHLQ